MSSSSDSTREVGHGAAAPAFSDLHTAVVLDRDPHRLGELAAALERDGIVPLATETTVASAATAVERLVPSVALLGTETRDDTRAAIDQVALLRRRQPKLKIVCLHDARWALGPLFAAGADAVFLRQSPPTELARAVGRLLRDDAAFVPVPGRIAVAGSQQSPATVANSCRNLGAARRHGPPRSVFDPSSCPAT